MKYIIVIIIMLSSISCNPGQERLVEALRPPAIIANPISPNLFLTAPRVLSAQIIRGGSAIEIIRIDLVLNRDRDPINFSPEDAPIFTINNPPQAGNVAITLPPDFALEPAQLLTARWFVDYRLRTGGNDIATVISTVTTRQACDAAETTRFLSLLQRGAMNYPQQLESIADLVILQNLGYNPTHSFVSFRGMGVAFATLNPLMPRELIEMGKSIGLPEFTLKPHLLMYAPNSTNQQQVSEPLFPDFPYTLIGFAFASPYDPSGPPVFGCMPRESWFVHEAGWHMANGDFILDDIDEPSPGDQNPILPSSIPPTSIIWHPRLWDVHLWINPDTLGAGRGIPIVSMCNRMPDLPALPDFSATTSAATCDNLALLRPQFGAIFPADGFFIRLLPP